MRNAADFSAFLVDADGVPKERKDTGETNFSLKATSFRLCLILLEESMSSLSATRPSNKWRRYVCQILLDNLLCAQHDDCFHHGVQPAAYTFSYVRLGI